jgi:peptidoglycan glycosyltransferase
MLAGVRNFGLGEEIPFDLPGAARSTFGGDNSTFRDSLALLAIHGFGQGSVQMVPLHMASIAAAIANGGRMMKPFIIADTRTHDNTLITQTQPSVWKTPMLLTTSQTLTKLMIEVAKNGTASCCLRLAHGVQAAAKTGTAQLNKEGKKQRSHAWIIAFAPANAPRVAVAVMLKGVNDTISAGTGGRLAGPVARALLNAALSVVP